MAGRDAAGGVAEGTAHFASRVVALAGIERERDRDRIGELGANCGDECVERRRSLLLLLECQLGQRCGFVGQTP